MRSRSDSARVLVYLFIIIIITAAGNAAVMGNGKVCKVEGNTIQVMVEGTAQMKKGVHAKITHTAPHSKIEIMAATGVVSGVNGATAIVTIEKSFGTPVVGQNVSFSDTAPRTPPPAATQTPKPGAQEAAPKKPRSTSEIGSEEGKLPVPNGPTSIPPIDKRGPYICVLPAPGQTPQSASKPSPRNPLPVLPSEMYSENVPQIPAHNVIITDKFSHRNANDPCLLGKPTLEWGGVSGYGYLPIFPGSNGHPAGAIIRNGYLENNGQDYGGVQFAMGTTPCNGGRGTTMGENLAIELRLRVPEKNGMPVGAGPYFRSRAAASGDGILGGTSAGYWVQLWSNGEMRVVCLNPQKVIATAKAPAGFDSNAEHMIQTWVSGRYLVVFYETAPVTFVQNNISTRLITLPNAGSRDNTAGIAFSPGKQRGKAGGQQVSDIIVAVCPAPQPK